MEVTKLSPQPSEDRPWSLFSKLRNLSDDPTSRSNYTCLYSSESNSSDIAQRSIRGARDDHLSSKIMMLNHQDKP
jgi:hypothetical protein